MAAQGPLRGSLVTCGLLPQLGNCHGNITSELSVPGPQLGGAWRVRSHQEDPGIGSLPLSIWQTGKLALMLISTLYLLGSLHFPLPSSVLLLGKNYSFLGTSKAWMIPMF